MTRDDLFKRAADDGAELYMELSTDVVKFWRRQRSTWQYRCAVTDEHGLWQWRYPSWIECVHVPDEAECLRLEVSDAAIAG